MKYFFYPTYFLSALLLSALTLLSACSSDPDHDINTVLSEARLTDFKLLEVDYLSIDITHPVIENGREIEKGTIAITIPYSRPSLSLTLKQFTLDNNRYSIYPPAGISQDFSTAPVTYTITANHSPEQSVHYDVSITHGGPPYYVNRKVTGFKFEKQHNPQLAETVEALKIAEYENGTENAIYVIVPQGTDLSSLKPTVTYDAAKLYYDNDTGPTLYPEGGITADLKYPKHFYLQAENSSGERSKRYNVIVEVANPIKFDNAVLTTPDVAAGDNISFENFFEIIEWTNQGNHPITGMSPDSYTEQAYPGSFPDGFTVITTSMVNPNGGTPGVLPGEKGKVHVRVKRMSIPGSYSAKAIFQPTFSFDTRIISYWPEGDRVEGIFSPAALTIQTMIKE